MTNTLNILSNTGWSEDFEVEVLPEIRSATIPVLVGAPWIHGPLTTLTGPPIAPPPVR
jgi:hypothetical protein